jgi:uncharacterized protein YkwD
MAILVLAALNVLMGMNAERAAAAPLCDAPEGWGRNQADLAARVLRLINGFRADNGLRLLERSPALVASARWKSLNMARYGRFAHDDSGTVTRSAHGRALDCGYGGGFWGENIALGYGSPRAVVAGWLASPGHRANIANPSYTSTGVGVAASRNGTLYWTESFGVASRAATKPPRRVTSLP